MFDISRLKEVLVEYKKDFIARQWSDEKYKWEAVKHFQDNWDVNAANFASMLERSLAKTYNLLASMNNFPARMIVHFAKIAPEEVRALFIALFDEGNDYYGRIEAFKQGSTALLEKYGNGAGQHYQYENAITTYLWLRYPDRYYIYKFGEVKKAADELDANYRFKKGAYSDNVRSHLAFYDEICAELKKDEELVRVLQSQITPACYPDPELRTLTIDVCFYISRLEIIAEDWFPPKADYDPGLSVDEWLALLGDEKVFTDGSLEIVKRLKDYGGAATCTQLAVKYGETKNFYLSGSVALARRVVEKTGCPVRQTNTENSKWWPVLYMGKYADKNEEGSYIWRLRDELSEAFDRFDASHVALYVLGSEGKAVETYTADDFFEDVYMSEERYAHLVALLRNKKNVILQGAPGVGKTFTANRLAWSLMGKKDDSRIEFIQFHQNYTYEDFMMGYKPQGDTFKLKYGVFYRFCQKAANHPDKEFFFIIDEINRGNMSKIFGELLMLIECDYRGYKATLAYNGLSFSIPANLYIIGMMNTADRSLAMIDYALRRRFSFFEMEPGFDSEGFAAYQKSLASETLDELVEQVKKLNAEIAHDKSLGRGFCIGHSYFCGRDIISDEWLREVVDYDILPMLSEYWFDDETQFTRWENALHGVFQR